ncbi:hypothetical protein F7O43_11825, partial [Neisseria meningitidis]|nr:hypothetical protein [Neisseria meningitidis]MCG8960002.1 hypothetical protein [Neisseria meningitidis]
MHGRLKISLMRWKNFIWQKQFNKYKLIYKQYDKYFIKFLRKRLTANLFKRIVRFFAAAEVADELKSIAQNVGDIERYLDRR